jgi:hypothetical protein
MSAHKLPLHLRQLANLREAILDTWTDGALSARVARVRRGLQLRDRLLRKHGVDALDERTAKILLPAVARGDMAAARLAFELLRHERATIKG